MGSSFLSLAICILQLSDMTLVNEDPLHNHLYSPGYLQSSHDNGWCGC